jgi:hypothetical protein
VRDRLEKEMRNAIEEGGRLTLDEAAAIALESPFTPEDPTVSKTL